MRTALWPDAQDDESRGELTELLSGKPGTAYQGVALSLGVLVACRENGGLCGFIELSIRPWASGCDSRPVGFVEGWYVDPDVRRTGVGRALMAAGESWAAERGCTEMASDTEVENVSSQQAHAAVGFQVAERLVLFHKRIG